MNDFSPVRTSASSQSAYDKTLLGRFDRKFLTAPAARWIMGGIVGLLLIIPSVQFVIKIHVTEQSPYRGEKLRSAVGRWLPDAKALVDGEDPYGFGHWFPNPPLVLMALVPLAYLPLAVTAVLWSLAKIAAVVGGCWLVIRSAKQPDLKIPLGVLLITAVFSARPIIGDIQHGNINIFVFFEIALAWYLFVHHRDLLAGIVIGLAIVTKVTPALLLVYFLYKRAWRVVAGGVIGLVVFAFVIPSLALGFERNIELLTAWFNMMVDPFVFQGFVTIEPKNQSLSGMLMRLLSLSGLMELQQLTFAQAKMFGTEPGTMARSAGAGGQMILRGANLLIVAMLAWSCRSSTKDRRDPRLLLELSLVLLAMLLLSERTWKHHLTTLPIVYLAVWLALTCYPWPKRFTALCVVGLIVQLLLLLILKGNKMMFVGVITLGLLLCFIQNAILLKCLRRESACSLDPPIEPSTEREVPS